MDIYQRLGLKLIINCAATYTRLGGSIMEPHVAQAMADAAGCFIDLSQLQAAVGNRLAEITQNEAAYVCNGAAAGLALATAACITGDDISAMMRLPADLSGLKDEIIIHRAQRNYYDFAIRQTGARLIEIGHAMETTPLDLESAFSDRTAAVFYFAGKHLNLKTLPLATVVELARARGVPVVVDAAAQIPPVSNLWHFTKEVGADLVIFSGGKGIRGPQNSGLILGRADLIHAVSLNGPPVQRIGRPMKVAKEPIIGLLVAVETLLQEDVETKIAGWTARAKGWYETWRALAPAGIELAIDPWGEAGQPIARVIIHFGPAAPLDRDGFIDALRTGERQIEVVVHGEHSVALSAELLQPGEAEIADARVREVLTGASISVREPSLAPANAD
ncbi:MAG: aminotransferase class V-fold PLP-dependent enzyme [Chloroflexia bacterium]|nr:aminotransferase class V-fold PLP-dependent enzyme [Chloroflexia bacterium]